MLRRRIQYFAYTYIQHDEQISLTGGSLPDLTLLQEVDRRCYCQYITRKHDVEDMRSRNATNASVG